MSLTLQPGVVAQPELAEAGQRKIEWVRRNMPLLNRLEDEFRANRPFAGKNIVVCVHLEAKTAYLALVLAAGGARVAVTGSNPDSTKDDVVAALDALGLHVYARHGATPNEMRRYLNMALDIEPAIVIDDGGDVVELLHDSRQALLAGVLGVCEETTTGVTRARERAAAGALELPVLLINDARCKHLFDNVHGTGQSVWDAFMRSTNLVLAGKTVTIVGYGWCGNGCALRAAGLGASVVVSEIDPVKAVEAHMMGYRVMPLIEACAAADVVLTATGVQATLRKAHFEAMRDGVIVANAGHFRDEVDVEALHALAQDEQQVAPGVRGYTLASGNTVYLLGDGNIVNIACADGHPAEIMDTSFALQALCARLLATGEQLAPGVYPVPDAIDATVARLKLESLGISIDRPI